jgi:hypothetical protein
MASPDLSAFCRRALAMVGCALAITVQSMPTGRHVLSGHIPSAVTRLKPTGLLAETNGLRLALGLPLRSQAELAALLRQLYDPASSQFHQFLKPSEFAGRFGPTEEDYAAVSAFARSHNLRVVQTHANRLLLDVEGSVANVKEAFHVNMNVFQHPTDNRTFYAPETEPSIEAGLPLQHVSGLDNYLLPQSNLRVHAAPNPGHAQTGTGPNGAYMGRDFRAAYMPGVVLDGAGQTIALLEFDTFYPKDVTTYETMAGLPTVPVTTVPVDSFSGLPGTGNVEVALDIELSISMAPGLAQVLVYQAPNVGLTSVNNDLLNQIAMDDLASQIVCCWLFSSDSTSDSIFQEMAAQGQSFFNASGDSGAYDIDPSPLVSDPNITVVGGTTLTTSGSSGGWSAETVWNGFSTGESTSGGSGGFSATYPIPYWQQTINMSSNQGSTIWRNIPDVALTGDNVVLIADNGETIFGSGTSCATPLWAGLTAMINQQAAQNGRAPVGFLNPAIYGAARSALYPTLFHDITIGNNTNFHSAMQFFAAPGYDLCTGWGTPNGQALINALAPPDSLVLQPRGGLSFTVINGLPVPIETQTLALKTAQYSTVDWAFGPLPSWLAASASHGVVSPSLDSFITLGAADAATNLPPGEYFSNVLVTNLTVGVTHLFPVFLQVFDPLFVSPNSGMAVTGPAGGPFDETTQTYALTNFAPEAINWTAQCTLPFVDVSPASGTLAPGAFTNVVVTLNQAASNLLISAQSGNLLFTDPNAANTQSFPFTLTVGNGGFETGDFSDWTFDGGSYPTNFVGGTLAWGDYIHRGAFAALIGEPYKTVSLSQSLPTVPGQLYQISLFLNNPVGGPTNQFEVKWDGTTLFNQANVPLIQWTNMQFAVVASTAATALDIISCNLPDYFGLDDISVTPIGSPTFTSGSISNGSFFFSWNATPGAAYQLQTSASLFPPQWINVGFPTTATNSIMTVREPLQSGPQRFYRVRLKAE